jgi:hypothetical protein
MQSVIIFFFLQKEKINVGDGVKAGTRKKNKKYSPDCRSVLQKRPKIVEEDFL